MCVENFLNLDKYNKYLSDLKNGTDSKEKKQYECVWGLDILHDGEVEIERMFGVLDIPICRRHLEWHKNIIALCRSGMDIHEILALSLEECVGEVLLRGLTPNEQ